MSDAKITLSATDQTAAAFAQAKRNLAGLGEQASLVSSRMGSLGAAIAAALTAQSIKGIIDAADQLNKLSQKTGIAVETLSELKYAGSLADVSIEAIATSVKKLASNMFDAGVGGKDAAENFKLVGVSIKNADGSLRSTDEVLGDLADAFANLKDGPEKAALAVKLLGKAGADMIPLLNGGREGLQKMRLEAQQLGAVVSADVARAAEEFNDNLTRIGTLANATARDIAVGLLPVLNELTASFIEARKEGGGFSLAADAVRVAMETIIVVGSNVGFVFRTIARDVDASTEAYKAFASWDFSKMSSILGARTEAGKKERQGLDDFQNRILTGTEARRLQDLNGGDFGDGSIGKPSPNKTLGLTDRGSEAKNIAAQAFINQLITEYANLSGNISKTEEVMRKLNTATDKFTASQRAQSLSLAAQIDAQKVRIFLLESETRSMQALGRLKDDAENQYAETLKGLRESAINQEFELTLLGKTAEQVERLRFEREQDLKLREAEVQVIEQQNNGLLTEIEARQRLNAIRQASDRNRIAFDASAADKRDLQYNPDRGVQQGIKEYLLEVEKAGEHAREATVRAFKGMEDALVSFVKTGKLDFTSLADSIITDLIRMQVQQSVTRPLGQLIQDSGGASGLFSGARSFFGFADGGVMSSAGPLPLNAYANGGIASTPQLALFGEGRMNEAFVPLPDGRSIPVSMQGGMGGDIVIHQPITINANNASAETVGQIRALMPGFIAENARLVEGVVRQAMARNGGRF